MTIDCSKKPLAESIAIIKKINQARVTENLKSIFGTKEKVTENLKEIFGEKLTEKSFGNEDMMKGPEGYLRRVLTDFTGDKGVKLMNGQVVHNAADNKIDIDSFVNEILSTELPLKGKKNCKDYSGVSNRFSEITKGLTWTQIDKSVYSGKGSDDGEIGLRSLSDWSQDAQEAILIQLLAGKIKLSDIAAISTYLNNNLDLKKSGSITDREADVFLKGWQKSFTSVADAQEEFAEMVQGKLGFDLANCTVIHQAVKNEYTSVAKLILNNKTAATYDKADAYIMANDAAERVRGLDSKFQNVTDNNSFLATYESIRKAADPAYPGITRKLVNSCILLGVSLKKITNDHVIIEYNPQIPLDSFTGEVIVYEARSRISLKDGNYYRNLKSTVYVNFPVKPGSLADGGKFITLCVRPNGGKTVIGKEDGTVADGKGTKVVTVNITNGSNRIEWRSCEKINSLKEVAFGSGTDVIKGLYGDEFSSYLNSGSEDAYKQAASYLLKNILGMKGDVVFHKIGDEPVAQKFPNTEVLTELFCRIAGFGTDSSATAVYLKVY